MKFLLIFINGLYASYFNLFLQDRVKGLLCFLAKGMSHYAVRDTGQSESYRTE